jgi:hypothetical protein
LPNYDFRENNFIIIKDDTEQPTVDKPGQTAHMYRLT